MGRDEDENRRLQDLKEDDEYTFEVPDCGSPTTLLQGPKIEDAVKLAAQLTAHYSDSEKESTEVRFGSEEMNQTITVIELRGNELENFRVTKTTVNNG